MVSYVMRYNQVCDMLQCSGWETIHVGLGRAWPAGTGRDVEESAECSPTGRGIQVGLCSFLIHYYTTCCSEQPVTDVSCGDGHSCCLTGSGIPYCWGDNSAGQLGVPLSTQEVCRPRAVLIPTGYFIIQVACGANFTVALSCKFRL